MQIDENSVIQEIKSIANILIPAHVHQRYLQVKLRILHAQDVLSPSGGDLNCFIKEETSGVITKTVKHVDNIITWE